MLRQEKIKHKNALKKKKKNETISALTQSFSQQTEYKISEGYCAL